MTAVHTTSAQLVDAHLARIAACDHAGPDPPPHPCRRWDAVRRPVETAPGRPRRGREHATYLGDPIALPFLTETQEAMSDISRLTAALSDRYTLERELGQGGMATVYLAHDLKHDRKVAIKVLKPELTAVLGAERFVVEIKTTVALSHPHILPLLVSGTADGFLFYVMPYIQGETIREKLNRETQCGVDEAVRIAREVADALD